MPELKDGESVEIQGSARNPYVLKKRRRCVFLHVPGVAKPITCHRTADL